MAPLHKIDEIKEIKAGDLIRPNSYLLKIEIPGYETVEIKQNVWPDERPFSIDYILKAKPIIVHLNITYDIEPINTPCYNISKNTSIIIDTPRKKNIARFL